jgi:gamma-glutamyl:cysteine ligase YbdK (ATP-grasp superfamily)
MYIRTPSGKRAPLSQELAAVVERMMPVARESGEHSFLSVLSPADRFESGADRQRRLYRETGSWTALVDDMTTRLAEELKTTHV